MLCSLEMGVAEHITRSTPPYKVSAHAPDVAAEEARLSWMWKSYGGSLAYDDPSPNIGVWWFVSKFLTRVCTFHI